MVRSVGEGGFSMTTRRTAAAEIDPAGRIFRKCREWQENAPYDGAVASPALLHTYAYREPSTLEKVDRRARLTLSTSGRETAPAFFFEGLLVAPRRAALAMLEVARTARTRFFVPPSMLAKILAAADPVVTCTDRGVRFESFSACAGVYARFDLTGFDAAHVSSGTTNVDFNPEMRALLAEVAASDELKLSVGRDQLRVASPRGMAVERKVPLPLRWLRSFGDVQAVLARMKPTLRVSGVEARRFLRGLPRGSTRGGSFIVRSGPSLRVSQVRSAEAVAVGGLGRLASLAAIADDATELVAHGEPSGCSAWELVFPDGRFTLALSPDSSRGFSGEGGLLLDLAAEDGRLGPAIAALRAKLRWQSALDARTLAVELQLPEGQVLGALAALATRGLVGFDLATGSYFHRELPFALDALEGMHPRLEGARALVEGGAITEVIERDGVRSAEVAASGGGSYRVTLGPDEFRCTCAWYGKHAATRGPCKHVLALQLAGGEDS